MNDRKFVFFSKHDVLLILIICSLATILNMYANPFLAATVVVGGILLMRVIEHKESTEREKKEKHAEEEWKKELDEVKAQIQAEQALQEQAMQEQTIEKRSAHEIITEKLNNGAIEKAIDERFDQMLGKVVDELFGNYGDVSRNIQSKLKENMNSYIDEHDFSQYNTKLEHLLNQLVETMTKDQSRIIHNTQQLLGLARVEEAKASELFDTFAKYAGANIDTSELEIDTDDTPSYKCLTGRMVCSNGRNYTGISERKTLTFTCDEDKKMGMTITIRRWVDRDNPKWTIESIKREVSDEEIARQERLRDNDELTSLHTPFTNLRDLNDLEVYFLKLFYDGTSIILDETNIIDEDIEVEVEPEYHLS